MNAEINYEMKGLENEVETNSLTGSTYPRVVTKKATTVNSGAPTIVRLTASNSTFSNTDLHI